MVEWAGYLSTYLTNTPRIDNGWLGSVYYDGEDGAYKIRDYLVSQGMSTTVIDTLIQQAFDAYSTDYVIPNNGGVQGFRNFTGGQLQDFLRNSTRKTDALTSIALLLANASYQNSNDVSDDLFNRECAYSLKCFINAVRAGTSLNGTQLARRSYFLECILNPSTGHVAQWKNGTADYFRPFMGALTAYALTEYFTWVYPDSRIVQAVKDIADMARTRCWKSSSGSWGAGQSFLYTDRITGGDSEDGNTTPDLNLLILPMFGFVWWQTGDSTYRQWGDEAWVGGVPTYLGPTRQSGADLGTRSAVNPNGKHVFQQTFWADKYITWAESDPVSIPVTPPVTGSNAILTLRRRFI